MTRHTKTKTRPKPHVKPRAQETTTIAKRSHRADVQVVDAEVASVMPFATGTSLTPFTSDQQKSLSEPATDDELDVRPDNGAVYMPHVYIRRRLTKAFGVGGWRLLPSPGEAGVMRREQGPRNDTLFQSFQLWVGNYAQPIAEAFGFARYFKNNPSMDIGDAIEAMKSNALMRCTKSLDIGGLVEWDKRLSKQWRDEHCILVHTPEKSKKFQWRRTDADPLEGEKRPASSSERAQATGRPADEGKGYQQPTRRAEPRQQPPADDPTMPPAPEPPGLVPPPADQSAPQVIVNIKEKVAVDPNGRWQRHVIHAHHFGGTTEYSIFSPAFKVEDLHALKARRAPVRFTYSEGSQPGTFKVTKISET